jgi:epoxide hydrolase-like predicted phosphatase
MDMCAEIKCLIFDLGGVIVYLDFSNFYNKIITQSPINKPQTPIMLEFFRQSDIYHQGNMTDDEFYQLACEILQVCMLDKSEFFYAFNSIISGFNEDVIELLRKLRYINKYKILALSNINASHWDIILKTRKWDFIEYFDELILSHEVHMMKPDPKLFEYAIEKAGCKPEEILYIDDGLNNIRVAAKLGIIGINFTTTEDLVKELQNLNIFV